jgi:hypothetical protein
MYKEEEKEKLNLKRKDLKQKKMLEKEKMLELML